MEKELILVAIAGSLVSLVASFLLLGMRRLLMKHQEVLMRQENELVKQREIILRQSESRAGRPDRFDNPHYRATDRLIAKAYAALEADVIEASIIIAAAAVESRMRSLLPDDSRQRSVLEMTDLLIGSGRLPPSSQSELYDLWQKRNQLVHDMADFKVSRSDAMQYLRRAEEVLYDLTARVPE